MDKTQRREARLLARGARRRAVRHRAGARHFLFAGEAGSCLGGMEDFYGAYGSAAAAQAAVPPEAAWADIATVCNGTLIVIMTGERSGRWWRWRKLDDEGERTRGAAA